MYHDWSGSRRFSTAFVNSPRIRQEHRRKGEKKSSVAQPTPTQGIHLSTVPRSIPLGGESSKITMTSSPSWVSLLASAP